MSFPIKTSLNDMNKHFCLSVSILNKPKKQPKNQHYQFQEVTHTHTTLTPTPSTPHLKIRDNEALVGTA